MTTAHLLTLVTVTVRCLLDWNVQTTVLLCQISLGSASDRRQYLCITATN